MDWVVGPAEVSVAAQLACLLEVSAPKPGKRWPRGATSRIHGTRTFFASAAARKLAGVGCRPIGATVRLGIDATAQWTRSNTNLGLVLLLTPLARAALERKTGGLTGLRDAVRRVLEATTVDDAREGTRLSVRRPQEDSDAWKTRTSRAILM